MAGNSSRKGAVRRTSKAPAPKGSGGNRRQGLEGKGPTPRAEDRPGHKVGKRAAAAKAPTRGPKRAGTSTGAASTGAAPRGAAPRAGAPKTAGTRTGAPKAAGAKPRTGTSSRSSAPRAGTRGRSTAPRTTRPTPRGAGRPGQRETSEMVAGRNPVVEALRASVPASSLYVALKIDVDDRVREALRLGGKLGVPLLEVPRQELDRLTDGASHQGLALRIPPYEYAHPDDLVTGATGTPLIVALDGVTDPRNLGAVIRSTAAFGGSGVVVPERRAAGMTASAWKASAGAAARVRVARAANLTRALEAYKAAGLFVVGLDADGELEVGDLEVATGPLVLVVGSEGKGLSRLVQATCDLVVRIPIAGDTESLNASVAASIALHDIARTRRG